MRLVTLQVSVAVLCFSFIANGTYIATLSFNNITANDAVNAAAGEEGLFLEVYSQFDVGGGEQVMYVFGNDSPAGGVIAKIYFDEDLLLAGAQIVDNPSAVDFEENFRANNIPGGNMLAPRFEVERSFLAVNPAPWRGVGVGEELGIIFGLQTGHDIDGILSDLKAGEFRIGLHVISFNNGNSESFVNEADFHLPEPVTAVLLGLGGLLLRRRKNA